MYKKKKKRKKTLLTTTAFAGKACETPPDQCALSTCTDCCDLKVYVTWAGTDANGRSLVSAGLRFSRFRQFQVASLYNAARNTAQQIIG